MANEKPVGGATTENRIDLVMSRYKYSANHHQTHFRRTKSFYDLYRMGAIKRNFPEFRNNVHLPFALTIIETDVAQKVVSMLGGWPPVEFVSYSPENAGSARKNEALIGAQLLDCNAFVKMVDFLTSADVYGLGVLKMGWTQNVELEKYREPNTILGGEEIKSRFITTFDGPDFEVLDILDCFPQPNVKLIENMAWFIYRYYLDLDELERRARLGSYDLAAVNRLKQGGMGSQIEGDMKERMGYYRTLQDYSSRAREKYAKPIEIIEYWGTVPSEFAPDGVVNRVLSVANGNTLLRDRPNPFFKKSKPFLAYSPIPDMHEFHGIGKLEPIAKMCVTASKLASQKLDGFDLALAPTIITAAGAGLDKQNLILRPGKVITADSATVGDDIIRPLTFDLRGMEGSYQEIEQLWRWSQYAAATIESTSMGAPGPDRETATGFMGRAQAAGSRPMLEVMLAERQVMEPLCNYMRALNRQFLKMPHMVKILGPSAGTNPITGLPLPPEPIVLDHSDINMDYQARARGATQMLSRGMRRQDMLALLQATAANPVTMQLINWAAFYRQLFTTFDITNVDELFNSAPTALGATASGAGGTTATAAPSGILTADNLGG